MLTAATTSSSTFKTSILKDPRLNYPKLRLEIIELAANMCTEAVGNDGLLPWLYSQAQRNSLPGGMVVNAAGIQVPRPIFDLLTPIEVPHGGANNAAIKVYDVSITDRRLVVQGLQKMKTTIVTTLPPDDLSELRDPMHGMHSVTSAQIFAHYEAKYGTLNVADYDIIYARLQAPKLPGDSYSTLAEIHRDLHALLRTSGQPTPELQKTTYFSQALLNDYAGTKAVELFVNAHPTAAARNFNDIVAMVILHAPTIVPLTSNLGYSNAMATTSHSSAFAAAPTDEVALAQLIAKSQKDLAALKKRNGTSAAVAPPHLPPAATTRTGGTLKYCYKHGYNYSHAGPNCKFLLGSPQLYTAQHLHAKDPTTPAGGNPNTQR